MPRLFQRRGLTESEYADCIKRDSKTKVTIFFFYTLKAENKTNFEMGKTKKIITTGKWLMSRR